MRFSLSSFPNFVFFLNHHFLTIVKLNMSLSHRFILFLRLLNHLLIKHHFIDVLEMFTKQFLWILFLVFPCKPSTRLRCFVLKLNLLVYFLFVRNIVHRWTGIFIMIEFGTYFTCDFLKYRYQSTLKIDYSGLKISWSLIMLNVSKSFTLVFIISKN